MRKVIFQQIKTLTKALVMNSISTAEHYPKIIKNDIVWQGYKNIAFTLKDRRYGEIYKECLKEGAYNFMLIDGALIQMMYRFKGNDIVSHRLAFFPNPTNERFQDNPEDYEEIYYGNRLFADTVERECVAIPVRFDFDNDTSKFIECDHPVSHFSLGNYLNCRIPVSSPISPNKFIQFILRSFYFDKYKECFNDSQFSCALKFSETITAIEKKLLHINI